MSSKAKKKSHSSRNETRNKGEDNAGWSEWSVWKWSTQKQCWMRERTNAKGDTNYQYGAPKDQASAAPPVEQPRTVPSTAPPLAEGSDVLQPVYSESESQNPGSYRYSQLPDQGSSGQGWNQGVDSRYPSQNNVPNQDSPYSTEFQLPAVPEEFSGLSGSINSPAGKEGFQTPTSFQSRPLVADSGFHRPPLDHSSHSYPGPGDTDGNFSSYSPGYYHSFQSNQTRYPPSFIGPTSSNFPLNPSVQSGYSVDQMTKGLGETSFVDAHEHTRNSSNQSFSSGIPSFGAGDPSRFQQETYYAEEQNAVGNRNENINFRLSPSNVDNEHVKGRMKESKNNRELSNVRGVSQELTRNKSGKNIATIDPNTKEDPLHKEYRVHSSSEFQTGRLFKMLWSEPCGEGSTKVESVSAGTDVIKDTKFGEKVYSTIRRFVIVQNKQGHCLCVPVLTYGNRGTAKPGVKAGYHAIIHSSENAPSELPGEPKLFKIPVKVTPYSPRDKLRPESRVNYSKTYTVEHNVKVCFIGEIHVDSKVTFSSDFERTFFEK